MDVRKLGMILAVIGLAVALAGAVRYFSAASDNQTHQKTYSMLVKQMDPDSRLSADERVEHIMGPMGYEALFRRDSSGMHNGQLIGIAGVIVLVLGGVIFASARKPEEPA